MRIVLYSRVSTPEQNPEHQLQPLREFAKSINGGAIEEYVDYCSGSRSDRENFVRMLNDSDKRKFDLILVWSFDRFSREGWSNVGGYLNRLKRNGVAVKSYQEGWLDTTSDNPTTELLLTIFAWVAKQERIRNSERVHASYESHKKRADGKRWGRPVGSKDKKRRVRSGYVRRWKSEKLSTKGAKNDLQNTAVGN